VVCPPAFQAVRPTSKLELSSSILTSTLFNLKISYSTENLFQNQMKVQAKTSDILGISVNCKIEKPRNVKLQIQKMRSLKRVLFHYFQ